MAHSPLNSPAKGDPRSEGEGLRRGRRLGMVTLLLAAWGWRLAGLTSQSLWRDEVDSLRFATRSLDQALAAFTRPGENGPLYYLLLRPWLAVAGHSEYALRFPSAWLGALAIPLIFLWGAWLFGKRRHERQRMDAFTPGRKEAADVDAVEGTMDDRWRAKWVAPTIVHPLSPIVHFQNNAGVIAALLLVVNPYHVWYSQEARMYTLVVAVILLALWWFKEAMTHGGWRAWALWYGFTSLSFYIHVLAALALPVQVLWLIITPSWRKRWPAAAAALGLLILPYLPLIGWQWTLLTDFHFRTGHAFVPLGHMLRILFSVQLQGVLAAPGWTFSVPIFLLASALFLPPIRKGPVGLLATWWLLPPLLLYLITLITPLFTDRYMIWTLPALTLLLTLGAKQLARQQRWIAAMALLLLIGWQLHQGWRQMVTPIKPDLRAAAAYVAPRRGPDDLTIFLMPYIRHTYRYYDPGDYAWAEAPYANREPDASLVPRRLEELTAGYAGVWLVESEAAFYDREGLIHAWFNAHAEQMDEAHFTHADVFYYRFNRPE
ncbi:MAG TPA: hypothetical protein EYH29_05665 [Caldilineales bacterium]|nr:hypothetical protein [Caldilineales bacterium]